MKTLMPDTDAMNDASPVDEQGEEDSIEEEKGVPVPINDVPELPKKDLVQPTTRDDSDEFLKKHRGRRKKKNRFQGSHRHDRSPRPERRRSSRLRRNANLMDVLDPVKSKLDKRIEAHQQSRSPAKKSESCERPILESEGERDCRSPVMNPSLKDEKGKMWSDEDQSLLAKHINPLQEPTKFHKKSLVTLNPRDKGLAPEEMIGRTYLMPPEADGSRHHSKIMPEVQKMKDKAHETPECVKFKCSC